MTTRGPGEPCWNCGARADVGCKHRQAEGPRPVALVEQEQEVKRERYDRRSRSQGLNFHISDLASNLERAGELLGLDKRRDD